MVGLLAAAAARELKTDRQRPGGGSDPACFRGRRAGGRGGRFDERRVRQVRVVVACG